MDGGSMNHTKLKKEAQDFAKKVVYILGMNPSQKEVDTFLREQVEHLLKHWYELGLKDAEEKGGKK